MAALSIKHCRMMYLLQTHRALGHHLNMLLVQLEQQRNRKLL